MLSGSDVEEGDDEDGLARHVWDQYTNSRTDLTKAREKLNTRVSLLEMTSAPDNLATAPKVEVTGESKISDKKPLGGKVDVPVVPEDQKSKVLQRRKKPSMDLNVIASISLRYICNIQQTIFAGLLFDDRFPTFQIR